jgi:peptide/nickel transport system substrate-binding protein
MRVYAWFLTSLFVTLTLACQPAAPPLPPGQAAPEAVSQTLTIAAPADMQRSDVRADLAMYPVHASVYDTLVRMDEHFQPQPLLADRWEYRGNNTWRFTLHQGVKFHDGQSFNADTLKATFDRVAQWPGGGSILVGPNSFKKIDDYTVDITSTRPNLRMPEQLTHPTYGVIAPGSDPATSPVGTGPFKFVEYVKNERLVVERNPDYWGQKAQIQRLTFRFMPDNNTRVLALRAGEVDLAYDVPREAARDLSSTPGLKAVTSPVGAYEALYVNIHGAAPYDLGQDRAVRQALSMAVDRQAIVQSVWQGNAEVSQTLVPAAVLGNYAGSLKGQTYDPAAARQALDTAGWVPGADGIRTKNGRPLHLTLVAGFPTAEDHRPMPEALQSQLKQVGIDLAIVSTPDNATYTARLQAGEGDLWAEIGNQNQADPCFLCFLFTTQPGGSADYGKLFAPGEDFDTPYLAARSATTTDEAARHAAEAMHAIIDEDTVVIPIAGIYRIWGVRDSVQGFSAHPSSTNQEFGSVTVKR